jgi:predicted dehydrogenase
VETRHRKPLTAVLIGAGDRGYAAYGPYALRHPEDLRFVAVAEPLPGRRARFAQAHDIPPERQFTTWEELLAQGQLADAALVTTLDHLHYAPAAAALEGGYDVLLEKPMATTVADCVGLVRIAEVTGRLLMVCHQMRYTPFFRALHAVLESGRLGEIVTVEYRENLITWAQAHAFVRGHWRNSQLQCPKILAKGCHDLDLIYWMLGPGRRLSSFGGLRHFRPENAPAGAPERCTDGCPAADECPWHAPRMYLEGAPLIAMARRSPRWWERAGAWLILDHPRVTAALRRLIPPFDRVVDYRGWPISVISEETSLEARRQALEKGPWGRCVYRCDNDVADHQTTVIEMESGVSVVFTMQGHSHDESRGLRFDGSRATLRARFTDGLGDDSIEIHDHRTGRMERVPVARSRQVHGGGDQGVMEAFVRAARGDRDSVPSPRESLESHLMAFAAEQARQQGTIVELRVFREAVLQLDGSDPRQGSARDGTRVADSHDERAT